MASSPEDPELLECLKEGQCHLEGTLKKLSSKNVWQKRHYQIRGPFLMYWATAAATKKGAKKGYAVSMPNVSIDLRLIRSADQLKGPVLILTSKSGQIFSLKPMTDGGDLSQWLDQINVLIKAAAQEDSTLPTARKNSRQTVMVMNSSLSYVENDDDVAATEEEISATHPDAIQELEEDAFDRESKSKFDEQTAATKVQAITRGKLSKKRVQNIKEEKATVKIQNLSRKKKATKKVEAIRVEKKQKEEDTKKVVKLQGLVRQKEAKKRVALVRETKLQSGAKNDWSTPADSSFNSQPAAEPTAATTTATTTAEEEVPENDDSNYRGVLEKAGHFVNTGYKKRIFVLTKDKNGYWNLSYFVDEGQGRLGEKKGDIELKQAKVENLEDSVDETEFVIVCPDKSFPLRALTLESGSEWRLRLDRAIKENNDNILGSALTQPESAITQGENGEAIAKAVSLKEGPAYRGVLEKAGHFLNHGFKKRLFVLAATPPSNTWVLFYYIDEGQGRIGELKGEINLKHAKLEKGVALNEFTVVTKEKSFPLRAENDESSEKWKEKIQQAIALSS